MTEARVVLYGPSSSTYDIPPNSGENIDPSYQLNKAVVTQGRWIFYDGQYNKQCKHSKLVMEGEGKVDLGFICESAREVEYKADGICLFEHYNYCGKMQTYINSQATLPGYNSGVSAAVIFPSSNWDLFDKEHFKGLARNRAEGNYPTAASLGVPNDTVKSIRRA